MAAKLKVNGMNAAIAALDEFPKKFANKAVKGALKQSMTEIVLRDAQRTVPVDSGQLRKSLKVRTAKGGNNKRLKRGVLGFAVQAVKTKSIDAYYSGWVFLGAKNRDGSVRIGTRTLRNALYGNAQAWKASVTGKLRKELPKIAREVRIASLKYKG